MKDMRILISNNTWDKVEATPIWQVPHQPDN